MKKIYMQPQTAVHKIEQSLPIAVSNPSITINPGGSVGAGSVDTKYYGGGDWDIWGTNKE